MKKELYNPNLRSRRLSYEELVHVSGGMDADKMFMSYNPDRTVDFG